MKIIFCAYDRPNHFATGPNAWIKRLIPDLIKHQIEVVTLFIHFGNENECPTINYFKNIGLSVVCTSFQQTPFIEDQIRWILQGAKKINPDIIVANLVVPAFYVKRYVKNIPVIGVLHSNDRFYQGVIKNFIHKNAIIQIDAVVAVSEFLKTKALVSNETIPVVKIPCGTPEVSQKANYNGGKLRVLYAGRIVEEQKQISKLTKAFCTLASQSQDIEFSIYGDGPEVAKVESIIKDFNVQDKVKYMGAVPPEQIQEVMLKHHVFTLMSDYEGLPVALNEAMACGLVPVCLGEESGINEVIKDRINGLIVADREKSFYNAINFIKENPIRWKEISYEAKSTIENEYSSEINHNRWVNILKSISNAKYKKIKVPFKVKISDINPLHYGDNRRPPFKDVFINSIKVYWNKLRLFVKPRARIKKLFNNG